MAVTTICRACKTPIAIPHCDSRNCNWCKACHERKTAECGKKP